MQVLIWIAVIALNVLCGLFAANKGRRRWLWTAIAFVVSPFLTWIVLLLLRDVRTGDDAGKIAKHSAPNRWLLAFGSLSCLLAVIGLVGISKDGMPADAPSAVVDAKSVDTPKVPQTPSEQPSLAETAPPPPAPTHYYSIAQDGEYGYQPALSDDDRKAGTMTKALLMARYQGKSGKKYRVDLIDNGITTRVSCEAPCEFVKSEVYLDGQKARTDTVAAAEGSLIWAILQDAMNGELEVYQKPKG